MPSGGSGGGQNTVETQSGPPAQVLANYQNVFGQAQNVSQQPYPTYDGSLVAGFTPQQTAGFNNINTAVNAGTPFLNAASQATTNAATSLDPQNFGSTVQSYYNPYAQGVIAPTEAQFNQQNAIQQNQLSSQAGSAGAFGGDRLGVAEGVLGGQQQLAEAPQLAQLEATGYNQAATNAQSNAWLNSQAGFGFGNLGNEAQSLGLQGANAQLSAGAQQQQQAQQELNAPYQQFLAAQGYPYQATNFLNSIATGTGSLSGQQGSTTSPGPSALSQVAGAGLAGAGLLGQTGAFGASGWLTGAGAGTAATLSDSALAAEAAGAGIDAGVDSGLLDVGLAAAAAKRGGRIEDVIRSMRGIHIPRRDDGGSVNPAQTAAFAGNPLNSNLYSIYSRLPTEKLQELAVRSPQNTMVTRALHMRQMNPQADPSVQTPGLAPAQASGMGTQQPLGQQPLSVTPAQTQAAPGGFAAGGWVHRDDGGLLDYDSLADQNDPPPMLGGLAPSSLGSRTPPIPGLGDTAGGIPDVGAGIPTQPIAAGLSIPIAAQPSRGRDTGEPLPQSATLAPTNSDFSDQSQYDHPAQTAGMGAGATHSSGPWNTLIAAGLGILGGTSPHAGVNIGQGGLKGLEFSEQQKLREQQQQNNDLYRQGLLNVRGQQVDVNKQKIDAATAVAALKTAEGHYTWQPGTQTDPSDPNKTVQGSYRFDARGNEPPQFFPGVQQTAKGEASVTGFGNTQNAGDIHGNDYLKTLDPKIATQVQAIADGRMQFPSSFALKTPYWQNMISAVSQYDPSFDAVNYNARAATRKDFTQGQSAKNITSLNTVMGHVASLKDAGDALQNGSMPLVNSVTNWIRTETGNPKVNNFQTAADAVADELEKSFRGTAGAVTGIRNWRERLSSSASPEQQAGAWKTLSELLDSRIDALGDQYSRGMGKTTDGLTLLSPHAQEAYQHVTGRTPQLPTYSETGEKSVTNAQQQAAPQGATIPAWVKPGDQYSPSRGQARSADGTIYGGPP